MHYFATLSLIAVTLFSAGCARTPHPWSSGRWVDLTHPFAQDTIYWPTSERFRLETVFSGKTEKGYFYTANQFCAAEHGGTHLDAPIHFAASGGAVDQIPLQRLIGNHSRATAREAGRRGGQAEKNGEMLAKRLDKVFRPKCWFWGQSDPSPLAPSAPASGRFRGANSGTS